MTDDGNIPANFKQGKTKKKVAPVDCPEKLMSKRQVTNMHVRILELLCASKKERADWASPVAHAFPPTAMSKCRFRDLLKYKRSANQTIPRSLALRIWFVFRGVDSLKLKEASKIGLTKEKK